MEAGEPELCCEEGSHSEVRSQSVWHWSCWALTSDVLDSVILILLEN